MRTSMDIDLGDPFAWNTKEIVQSVDALPRSKQTTPTGRNRGKATAGQRYLIGRREPARNPSAGVYRNMRGRSQRNEELLRSLASRACRTQ